MAHSETRVLRARSRNVILSTSFALALVGCSVYDASLLEHDSLGASGTDTGATGGADNVGQGGNASSHAGATSSAGSDAKGGSAATGATSGGGSSGTDFGGAADTGGSAQTGGTSSSTGGSGTGLGGATGGNATVGGSGGGGTTSNPAYSMIDDMENPDQYIPSTDGRVGFWSLANDGTAGGVQTPPTMVMSMISGGRGDSTYALHTTATGFTKTGAQVDVDINRKGATRSTYDASAYSAVHFFAKVATASPKLVHFAMPDMHTDPAGGTCSKAPQSCYDHFGTDLSFTTDWAEYTVKLSDLSQVGWGENDVTTIDVAHVYGINFSWTSSAMDLWIDDIAFVKK